MLIKQKGICKLLMIKSFLTIPGKALRRVGTLINWTLFGKLVCQMGLGGIEVVLVESISLRKYVGRDLYVAFKDQENMI